MTRVTRSSRLFAVGQDLDRSGGIEADRPFGERIHPERLVTPIIPPPLTWPGKERLPWFIAETDYRSEAVN